MNTFVGRENPIRDIQNALNDIEVDKCIRLISISGPGGVGKSFLLNHALSGVNITGLHYLHLRVDGNTSSNTLADILVRDLIASAPPDISRDTNKYFRVTRQGWEYLKAMDERAKAELLSMTKDDVDVAKVISALYEGAVGVLEIIPNKKSRKASRLLKRIGGKDAKRIESLVNGIKAYSEEKGPLWGFLPAGKIATESNLLRKDLSGRLAEYLTIDLTAIISGYRPSDWKRYLPSKVEGIDRLFLVIDDYEVMEPTLDDFLRQELIPRLHRTGLQTIIIIVGRDSICTNYEWDQYYGKNIIMDLRLDSFSEEESIQYLTKTGIEDANDIKRIIQDSLGLPFLLVAEAEWQLKGGKSALGLQKFVDRTTRWMTQEQKDWTLRLAFLENVNEDTVKIMMPETEPSKVVEWFKRESSIRLPDADKWKMLPILKSKIQLSVQNDSPSMYRKYKEQAEEACRIVA